MVTRRGSPRGKELPLRKTGGEVAGIVGHSPAMQWVIERIRRFAPSPIPVLILGESGTGKDIVAEAIWRVSGGAGPFTPVSCAAIPATLIESELFGHERGAFTGAGPAQDGLLAQADGGTLFLDEIAEIPFHAQPKLLRAIETREYRRVGGQRTRRSTFRVLAATHRDVDQMVERGEFRHDLLFRLGAARIEIPPLRDRPEDIPSLARHFLRLHQLTTKGERLLEVSAEALRVLQSWPWPGNVRELRNVIEAAASVCDGPVVEPEDLVEFLRPGAGLEQANSSLGTYLLPLAEVRARTEARVIQAALRVTNGNREAAAEILGVSRATLFRKLGGASDVPADADASSEQDDRQSCE